jgi:hypothetical protein
MLVLFVERPFLSPLRLGQRRLLQQNGRMEMLIAGGGKNSGSAGQHLRCLYQALPAQQRGP